MRPVNGTAEALGAARMGVCISLRPPLLAEAEAIGSGDRPLIQLSDWRRKQLRAGGLQAQRALEDAMLRVAADIRREVH